MISPLALAFYLLHFTSFLIILQVLVLLISLVIVIIIQQLHLGKMNWTKIILGQEQNPNSILIKQETLLSERL